MKRLAGQRGSGNSLLGRTPRLGRRGGLELTARRVLDGLYAGRHRSALQGSSVEFAEHRPYQPGDELRTIDWRAFARTDRVLIRRYHDDRQLPLSLVIDTSASMAYGEPAKLERAAVVAAALGLLALDQGDAVRLVTGDGSSTTAEFSGAAGAARVLELLETMQLSGASDVMAVLAQVSSQLTRRSLVVLCSDLLCEVAPLMPIAADLAARGHDLAVIQLLDRTEVALPVAWGRVTMTDPEGRESPFSCDTQEAQVAFDAAMAAHVEHCRATLTAARADHLLLLGDDDLAATLAIWLARRRRR